MYQSKYFYDKQIRRYLLQVQRMFSGFNVVNGKTNDGKTKFRLVPCVYADMTRLGATYLNNNSENVLNSAPLITYHVTDFQPMPEYRHNPTFEGNSHFTKKQKDEQGSYINKPGKKYTVTQLMPVPFSAMINVDIWTTSLEQKLELLEQITVWFNPGFDFLVSSSPMDMGRKCNIDLENIAWTSRSVPQGASSEIDVMTLTFKLYPIFITTPSKIKRQTLIHTVNTNVHLGDGDMLDKTLDDILNSNNIETTTVTVTPSGYDLNVFKDSGQYYARLESPEGYGSWNEVFSMYGEVVENETNIKIRKTDDFDDESNDIYATYQETNDPQIIQLEFDVDTFNSTTLDPVHKIINPNSGIPSSAEAGSRYLLGDDITIPDWGINASIWDIIEFDGVNWNIVFDASESNTPQYIINLSKMDLYEFVPEDKIWIASVLGTYKEGFWLFDVQKIADC